MKMVDSFEKIPLEIFPNAIDRFCICCKKNCRADPGKGKKQRTLCAWSFDRKISAEIICRTDPDAPGRRAQLSGMWSLSTWMNIIRSSAMRCRVIIGL